MIAFDYKRAESVPDAVEACAERPGARVIAGGTNLLDLMKIEVETPRHWSTSVASISARSRKYPADCASVLSSRMQNWPRTGSSARSAPFSRERCWLAPPDNCATRRQLPATCSSGPAATSSTTLPRLATNASLEVDAQRSVATTGLWRCLGRQSTASPVTRPIWRSQCVRLTRNWRPIQPQV